MATISDLRIGDVAMPVPKAEGVTISREKIWSSNTDRTASGKMVGDLVAIKYKIKIEWPPLTMEQAKLIDDAVSPAFFPVRFTDQGGTTQTITCYAGTPSYRQYSWAEGVQYVTGVAVDLVEQ